MPVLPVWLLSRISLSVRGLHLPVAWLGLSLHVSACLWHAAVLGLGIWRLGRYLLSLWDGLIRVLVRNLLGRSLLRLL